MAKQYIDNKALTKAVSEYSATCRAAKKVGEPIPPLTDYIAESLMLMVDRIGKKANFSHYTFLEEMKSDALWACCRYLHNFNPKKCVVGGAFAYCTQIITQAFIRGIQKEELHSYRKAKLGSITSYEGFSLQPDDTTKYARANRPAVYAEHEHQQAIIDSTELRLEARKQQNKANRKPKPLKPKRAKQPKPVKLLKPAKQPTKEDRMKTPCNIDDFRPCLKDDGGIYEDYYVSQDGRILSTKRNRHTILKPSLVGGREANTRTGKPVSRYHMIAMLHEGHRSQELIHRLVAKSWIGLPVGDEKEINHKDGNKLNNVVSNLEWCSHVDNMHHAWRNGLMGNVMVEPSIRAAIVKAKGTANEIAKQFDVDPKTVHNTKARYDPDYKVNRRPRISKEVRAQVIASTDQALQIVKKFGITQHTVYKIKLRAQQSNDPTYQPFKRLLNGPLSTEKKENILAAEGRADDIALKFGVGLSTVYTIKRSAA